MGYFSEPVEEACALLFLEGYFIDRIYRKNLKRILMIVDEKLKKSQMSESEKKKLLESIIDYIYSNQLVKRKIKKEFGVWQA